MSKILEPSRCPTEGTRRINGEGPAHSYTIQQREMNGLDRSIWAIKRLIVLNFWGSLVTTIWKFHFWSGLAGFMMRGKSQRGWALCMGIISLVGSGWLKFEDVVQHQWVWRKIYLLYDACQGRGLGTRLETRNIFWTVKNKSHPVDKILICVVPLFPDVFWHLFLRGPASVKAMTTQSWTKTALFLSNRW